MFRKCSSGRFMTVSNSETTTITTTIHLKQKLAISKEAKKKRNNLISDGKWFALVCLLIVDNNCSLCVVCSLFTVLCSLLKKQMLLWSWQWNKLEARVHYWPLSDHYSIHLLLIIRIVACMVSGIGSTL